MTCRYGSWYGNKGNSRDVVRDPHAAGCRKGAAATGKAEKEL